MAISPESAVLRYKASTPDAELLLVGDAIKFRRGTEAAKAVLLDAITSDRAAVVECLARKCGRCGGPYLLTSYWGTDLCRPCTHLGAETFDQRKKWPNAQTE